MSKMNKAGVMEYLTFRRMIIPMFVEVLFWVALAGVIIGGLVTMIRGDVGVGLALVLLGPIGVRFYAELLIVIFRINDTLTDIKDNMEPGGRGLEGKKAA